MCAAVNGVLASGGTIANAPPAIANRWKAIVAVFNDPNATPEELQAAITGLARFLKTPAALKMASMTMGDKVQVKGVRFGSEVPGLARYLKVANGIGIGFTAWSNYQGTNGNVPEAAVETGLDTSVIWASALVGAEIGTAIPVPIVGTAVGVTVGAVAGIVTTSVTNNAVDYAWHKSIRLILTVGGDRRVREGYWMGPLIAGLVALVVAGFHGVFVLRRLWTDPRYADRMVGSFSRLPYSPAVHRGAVRGSLMITAIIASVGVLFVSTAVSQHQGGQGTNAADYLSISMIFLSLACFATHLAIIWFNFPRQLALPSMRDDTAWSPPISANGSPLAEAGSHRQRTQPGGSAPATAVQADLAGVPVGEAAQRCGAVGVRGGDGRVGGVLGGLARNGRRCIRPRAAARCTPGGTRRGSRAAGRGSG